MNAEYRFTYSSLEKDHRRHERRFVEEEEEDEGDEVAESIGEKVGFRFRLLRRSNGHREWRERTDPRLLRMAIVNYVL